ncbi:MAG: hypothetical protein ACON4U_20530 [Myxococcota bacterium]
MTSVLIIGGVSLFIFFYTTMRIRKLPNISLLFWPVFLAVCAWPVWVANLTFFPAEQDVLTELSEDSKKVTVQLPDGHSLLVTAKLSELDPKDPNNGKTNYAMMLKGKGFSKQVTGEISRDSEPSEVEVDVYEGANISDGDTRRSQSYSENLQDRFDIPYSGELDVKIKNYAGTAAAGLVLSSVSSPPSQGILWAVVVLFFILGAFFEARYRADSVGGDFGFLGALAAFVAFGLTPLSGWHQAALTLLQAAFIGYVIFGYSAQGIAKYWASREKE